jgi:hypothetical protein
VFAQLRQTNDARERETTITLSVASALRNEHSQPAVALPILKVRAEHHRFFVSVKSASVTITLPKILLMTRDPQPKTRCLIVPSWSGRN